MKSSSEAQRGRISDGDADVEAIARKSPAQLSEPSRLRVESSQASDEEKRSKAHVSVEKEEKKKQQET